MPLLGVVCPRWLSFRSVQFGVKNMFRPQDDELQQKQTKGKNLADDACGKRRYRGLFYVGKTSRNRGDLVFWAED